MGLTFLDWLIVVVSMAFLIGVVSMSKRYMRSVADFLSAGRTAGRYMISMSQGFFQGVQSVRFVSSLQ